jgi:hypothetical protein
VPAYHAVRRALARPFASAICGLLGGEPTRIYACVCTAVYACVTPLGNIHPLQTRGGASHRELWLQVADAASPDNDSDDKQQPSIQLAVPSVTPATSSTAPFQQVEEPDFDLVGERASVPSCDSL